MTTKVKKTKLSSLVPEEYDEVSLVDSGANQDSAVVLFKRDTGVGGSGVPKAGTVVKKRVIRSCEQGHVVSKSDNVCSDCGSTDFTRSLMVIRKDDLESPDDEVEEVEDDELDDEEVEEDGDEEEVEDDEEDEDEEEDEEDEDEDDGDEDGVRKNVVRGYTRGVTGLRRKKRKTRMKEPGDQERETLREDDELEHLRKSAVVTDAASASMTLVEKLAGIFSSGASRKRIAKAYEDAMVEFNTVLDSASQYWVTEGESVSKADGSSVLERMTGILKEGGAMPKFTRPATLDNLELPDEVSEYIGSLEEATGSVEKKDDIYKGLRPEVAERIRKADELVEKAEVEKWEGIAKSFSHYPGDKSELAKSLRRLHEADPAAYETVRKTLEAGEYNLKQSSLFASVGSPHGATNETDTRIAKRRQEAEKLVEKGEFKTIEQAEVSLMGAEDYRPSVAVE